MYINSETIKTLRTDKAWTQQQLADICDLSMRTIQRVEKQSIGSLETSKALAVAFNVKRDLLIKQPTDSAKDDKKSYKAVVRMAISFALGMVCSAIVIFVVLYTKAYF
jgi:transcriptional regulator with XRE-family HTH domain